MAARDTATPTPDTTPEILRSRQLAGILTPTTEQAPEILRSGRPILWELTSPHCEQWRSSRSPERVSCFIGNRPIEPHRVLRRLRRPTPPARRLSYATHGTGREL